MCTEYAAPSHACSYHSTSETWPGLRKKAAIERLEVAYGLSRLSLWRHVVHMYTVGDMVLLDSHHLHFRLCRVPPVLSTHTSSLSQPVNLQCCGSIKRALPVAPGLIHESKTIAWCLVMFLRMRCITATFRAGRSMGHGSEFVTSLAMSRTVPIMISWGIPEDMLVVDGYQVKLSGGV